MNTRKKQIFAYVVAHLLMLLGWGHLLFIGINNTADNNLITVMALVVGGALAAVQVCALLHDFYETTNGLDDPETRW